MSIIEELRNKCEDCKPISTLKVGKYEFCACVDEDEINMCIAQNNEFVVCNWRLKSDFLFLLSYFLLSILSYGLHGYLNINKMVEENADREVLANVERKPDIFKIEIEKEEG